MAGACVDVTERREAEEALKDSEERLRLILESATDFAIFTMTLDRVVTTWSPGAEAAFGYTADEMIGRSGDVVFTPEDRAEGVPAAEAEGALRDGRSADERWHLRKDGTRFYASGVMSPLRDGGDVGFVKVARDLTERKRMEDALREAHGFLEGKVKERTAELVATLSSLEAEMERRRDMARRLATAHEDERRRMSRDLHDSVGQLMAGLSLALKSVEAAGKLPPASAAKLTEARGVLDALGREVHGLAVRLRPTVLDDIGLEPALEQLVSEWTERTEVEVAFQSSGIDLGRLAPEVETAVYRIVQEALTNVAKHARASAASVVLSRSDGHVTVVVEDDGVGFVPDAAPKGRLGLLGMRERAALVGGVLDVESSPGGGTAVRVRIPTSVREED
jgi:PAS domain S-box-containing protein